MTEYAKLKPFKSLILAEVRKGLDTTGLIESVLSDAVRVLDFVDVKRRYLDQRSDVIPDDPLEIGYIHYHIDQSPSWTEDETIVDTNNHLFLIVRKNRHIVIYLSESTKKHYINALFDQGRNEGLSALEPVSQYKLNNAYVTGNTRTLWLSGIHRRTTIKPDSKILAGLNLRDALDPLEDQSYIFTAARSMTPIGGKEIPIGCSPRSSRVWSSTSSSWINFREGIINLLNRMDAVSDSQDPPLPVVAYPIEVTDDALSKPFDIAFMPPGVDDPNIQPVQQIEIDKWGYRSRFKNIVATKKGKHIETDLYLDDDILGKMEFDITIDDDGKISWKVGGNPNSTATDVEFTSAKTHAIDPNWVKIWYESGLTVDGGQVYSVRYRDYPFTNFKWLDFSGYDISREKPTNFPSQIDTIGTDTSLFDWVFNFWPNLDGSTTINRGWLACDDGAGEIADFIHLGEEGGVHILSLIHVKASKTKGISVADYEVVGSQAIKNLRSLDEKILSSGLGNNALNKIGTLTWHDDLKLQKRDTFIQQLDQLGTNYKRRVVIFQPSLSRPLAEDARNKLNSSEHARLIQLDTLLLGIEADCHAMNAELWVIGNMH